VQIYINGQTQHRVEYDDNNNILSRIRNINAIKRDGSKCKYVWIFTHHIGSIGAPNRRAVFVKRDKHRTVRIPGDR
jgi:hypothetical protein